MPDGPAIRPLYLGAGARLPLEASRQTAANVWLVEAARTQAQKLRHAVAGHASIQVEEAVVAAQPGPQTFHEYNLPWASGPTPPEESLQREKGLISKPEVRLAALGRLQPKVGHTLWDIGAGSGSLALEASLFMRDGRILAVERDQARAAQIEANIASTGAFGVEVVQGIAPDCFRRLPDPDRIFLGGGAGQGGDLLDSAWERLRPGGRLVASLVLLGSLRAVLDWARDMGLNPELTQIQANRSSPIREDIRLAAQNPVFLLSLHKPRQGDTP